MIFFKCDNIEDLIFNKSFRNWVLYKQSQDTLFWESFVLENPDKYKLINDAKAIIYALQVNFKTLREEDINDEIRKVLLKINNQTHADDKYTDRWNLFHFLFKQPVSIAVSFLLLTIAGSLWYYKVSKDYKLANNYKALVENEIQNATAYKNNSDTIQAVLLPDKSSVSLSPKSVLSYSNNFNNVNRKVYLSGEAFFEVSKNPAKPFFVLTNTIVTKVLGTSFSVKAYPSKMSVVIVRTGKVSVIKASQFTDTYIKSGKLGGMLLTPNQQVTYVPESSDLNKSVTKQPVPVTEPPKSAFVFDATPVQKVFKVMQDAYQIPILFDEELLSSCSLSASMGDEPFYDKLNIICKAINATYEMIDGNIVITSSGCK